MSLGFPDETTTLRMAVVGNDYITNLGLTQLLKGADFIDMLGTFPNSSEALSMVRTGTVDLVLVDAALPEAELSTVCQSLGAMDHPPTIVVMGDVPYECAEGLFFVGVNAVLDPSLIAEDLPIALRMIRRGGAVLLSDYARKALKERNSWYDINNRLRVETLNVRERTVAQGVTEGLTNVQLAASMHMSEATVKLLVSNVMNKLGVFNRVQIAVVMTKARIG